MKKSFKKCKSHKKRLTSLNLCLAEKTIPDEIKYAQSVNIHLSESCVTLSGAFYAQKRSFPEKLFFLKKSIRHFRHFFPVISVIFFRHFDRKFLANQNQLPVQLWHPWRRLAHEKWLYLVIKNDGMTHFSQNSENSSAPISRTKTAVPEIFAKELAYIICASHTSFRLIVSGRCGTKAMRIQNWGKKHDHPVITHHVVYGKSFFPPPLSHLAI